MIQLYLAMLILGTPHDRPLKACATDSRIDQLNETTQRVYNDQRNKPTGLWTPADPMNEIDDITFATMNRVGVPVNQLCDDATFLRRTSLVLTGRIPDPDLTRQFLASSSPSKRADLIDELLLSDAFNLHWAFWFQEMFESTGRILRGGRNLYNGYFDEAVVGSKPFDQMAWELMTHLGVTDVVAEPNFYARAGEMSRLPQDFWDNSAIMASEKFLGVRIECVSCHDGAYHLEDINLYLTEKKREDLWGMAAFYADLSRRPGTVSENLVLSIDVYKNPRSQGYLAETDSGDRPERYGGLVEPKYMLDERGVDTQLGVLESVASYIINDRQFARNFANRLWAHAFGMGMVEPIDSFDLYRIDPDYPLPEGWDMQAFDIGLLEHMTDRARTFGFDLRETLRYICNSATFQLDSQFPTRWQAGYTPAHSRYMARRLSAESVYDSIVVATGIAIPIQQTGRGEQPSTAFYAHELDDIDMPRSRQDEQQAIRVFLDSFGRGNRFDVPRTSDGGIAQALLLMNSAVTSDRVNQRQGRLTGYLNQGLPIADIVDELFLDVLTRHPNDDEKQAILDEIESYGSVAEQARTALWLLLNKLEFIHIY